MMFTVKIMFASVMATVFDPLSRAVAFSLPPCNTPSSNTQSSKMGFSSAHQVRINFLNGETFLMTNNTTERRKKMTNSNRNRLSASTSPLPSDQPKLDVNRRKFSASFLAIAGSFQLAEISTADVTPLAKNTKVIIVEGVANLKEGSVFPASKPYDAALYITARPESMNNAPKDLFDAMGGRPPPVLTFPIEDGDSFPFSFQITSDAVTPEGAFGSSGREILKTEVLGAEGCTYWWSKDNLVISARLDTDGVAITRDPEDLVGRSISFIPKSKSDEKASNSSQFRRKIVIELQGRGIGGKFVTRKRDT
ncbi:hypothetical protein ACHAXS_009267 [Conticribra weissflogii]